MKVTIEVDCTPEEARRAMGLPDFTPIHEHYLARMRDAIDNGTVGPEIVGAALKNWAPMGDASADFWRKLFSGSIASKG